eukprot:TRINITY_DN13437_c0_g1_i1.p1 TRINITY_DN13437_c0_g1~~TRINITY_DN13437_c0_g1_i1.p1  ORF type:complete len:483 (-),score=77.44 TRINITY_DN13437_c0_g1_i1:72-1520(-)
MMQGGGFGQAAVLNCPHGAMNAPGSPGARSLPLGGVDAAGLDAYWQQFYSSVTAGTQAMSHGNFDTARSGLADALFAATGQLAADPVASFTCSLGIAAAYRVLALAFATDIRLARGSLPFRRAHQIALRFQHLAMVWITHVWEKFARREDDATGMANYDTAYIDSSAWPISLQEINSEMTVVQNSIAEYGRASGHQPRWPDVPHDFKDPKLRIGVVSLCAYPPDHVLPKFATSNHKIYTSRHGYRYEVGREKLDPSRPPAWGKIQIMYQALQEPDVDWWLWFDCDTYFMNMTVTLDSLLYKYARSTESSGDDSSAGLDPSIHMLVAEDHAMLNTGSFLLRSSDWSRDMLRRVWGAEDSVWIDHPWWENAKILWMFLKDASKTFRDWNIDVEKEKAADSDDMDGIYPPEVRLMPQAEANSYHPATSHFLHDTWEPGKFAIAFNGVLSNTSPAVIAVLYANYYELACQLNQVADQCVSAEDAAS